MDPQIRAHESSPGLRSLTLRMAEPLLTRDFDSRPALVYERLRAKYGSVAPVDVLGVPAWLVLGYPEVLEVLRNDRGLWSKRPDDWRDRVAGKIPPNWPLMALYEVGSTPFHEGRVHAELRGAWAAGLRPFQDRTQPQARRLEDEVRRYADELISLMGEGGPTGWADLSAQYARPLMLMVCNRLIGFELSTDEVLMDMWRMLDGGPDAAEATGRITGMLSGVIAAKRQRPGDDLASYMMAARPELTVEQITSEMAATIATIGDFNATLVCNTIVEVITGNAGARSSLAAGMIRETVNRAAMANPPNPNLTFRFATADTMLAGTAIAAGDPVMLSVAAAHADPRFAGALNPSSVHSSRAHLAWGAGAHQCPGDDLSTTLVTIAVGRLFERMAGLELALPADQLPWRSSPTVRGLRSLPVRYQLLEPVAAQPAASSGDPGEAEGTAPAQSADGASSRSVLARLVRAVLRQRG